MPVKSLRDGSVDLRVDNNGSSAEGTVTVDVEVGDLSYSEKRPTSILMDRGALSHARMAPDEPLDLSFSMMYQSHSAHSATTPYDVLKHVGGAASWVSQEALTDVWAIEVEFTMTDPASGSSEVLYFDRFVPETIEFSEGEEFNTLSVSGRGAKRSPFPTPDNLPGLVGWWDANAITGLSDGGAVTNWLDLAGEFGTLTQATSADKPTWQTNELNSTFPVVRFDGSNDNLERLNVSAFQQPYSYFLCAKHTSGAVTANENIIGGLDDGGSNDSGEVLAQQAGTDQVAIAAGTESAVAALTSSFFLLVAQFDGAASITRYNRAQTTESVNTRSLEKLVMGADGAGTGNFADCDIAELAIFDRKLTLSQMRQLEDYAAWKYGL